MTETTTRSRKWFEPLSLPSPPLKKISLQRGIVYGPVPSRRLGQSRGINLLPTDHKLCSFNCLYCRAFPAPISTASCGSSLEARQISSKRLN